MRTGAALTVATTARGFFGPFQPGQGIDGIWLAVRNSTAASRYSVEVSHFEGRPPDSEAGFATGESILGAGQEVVARAAQDEWTLPVRWVARRPNQFLVVQIGDLSTDDADFSVVVMLNEMALRGLIAESR